MRYGKTLHLCFLLRYFITILLRHDYVLYFFDVVTILDDVSIVFYFGMFELRTKIIIKGHFLDTFVWNQKNDKKVIIIMNLLDGKTDLH